MAKRALHSIRSVTGDPLSVRERLVQTASRLFYQDGIRATGIDRIIAEAEVAKMSFYKHFPAKKWLVVEYLRERSELWLCWFRKAMAERLMLPGAGFEVMAEVLQQWFDEPGFLGCPFIKALAETTEADAEIRAVIRAHKFQVEHWLQTEAERLDYPAPKQTAASLMLLMEGAAVRAHMTGDAAAAEVCLVLLRKLARPGRREVGAVLGEQLTLPGFA